MIESDSFFDYLFRVIIVGDSGVGKSNLILRYTRNEFDPSSASTIGVDFTSKNIQVENKTIKAQIWDTAGQDRFRSISTAFYRGAAAALVVFDLTNPKSFRTLDKWIEEIKRYADPNVILMLVGNKCDLKDKRAIHVRDAYTYAENNNMSYIETSALDNTNVDLAFLNLITDVYHLHLRFKKDPNNKENNKIIESHLKKPITLNLPESSSNKKKSCC